MSEYFDFKAYLFDLFDILQILIISKIFSILYEKSHQLFRNHATTAGWQGTPAILTGLSPSSCISLLLFDAIRVFIESTYIWLIFKGLLAINHYTPSVQGGTVIDPRYR